MHTTVLVSRDVVPFLNNRGEFNRGSSEGNENMRIYRQVGDVIEL
jgi:hypothetical protein